MVEGHRFKPRLPENFVCSPPTKIELQACNRAVFCCHSVDKFGLRRKNKEKAWAWDHTIVDIGTILLLCVLTVGPASHPSSVWGHAV